MGRKKISETVINERLFKLHGGEVSLFKGSFIGTNKKATFVHKKYGQWTAQANSVINNGSNHPKAQREAARWSQEEFEYQLNLIHKGVIRIVWDSWKGVREKAIFIHEIYGEFLASPDNILRGRSHPKGKMDRIKKTHIQRYGVEFPSQNKEIALKAAKSANDSVTLRHWKTTQEIVCRASYEIATVNYLNNNKIEYFWQPKIFETPLLTPKGNKATYCPDLFLINENKWIEIKGWFRSDALEKWNWFKSQYPNSDLWDKKKLKEIGII